MDPNACLILIAEGTPDEAYDSCKDLRRWLNSGGFAPDWGAHAKATERYLRFCARAGIQRPQGAVDALRAWQEEVQS